MLTIIRESWEKSKTRDRHRARFAGKKSRAQRCIICICFCALDFFRKSHSVMVSKIGINFGEIGIFSIILANALLIRNIRQSSTDTQHCICTYFSLSTFLNFSKIALVDGLENSRIRFKHTFFRHSRFNEFSFKVYLFRQDRFFQGYKFEGWSNVDGLSKIIIPIRGVRW